MLLGMAKRASASVWYMCDMMGLLNQDNGKRAGQFQGRLVPSHSDNTRTWYKKADATTRKGEQRRLLMEFIDNFEC